MLVSFIVVALNQAINSMLLKDLQRQDYVHCKISYLNGQSF